MALDPRNCKPGHEQHQEFKSKISPKKHKLIQYDYRHTDGKLFSCVVESLIDARQRRDAWLKNA